MPRQYTSPLRAKQAKQTRRAIIEAAIQLFLENGYAETSIRSIAEEAGVAERTVYVQFSDKTSILTAIGYHVFYGEESEDHDSQTEFKNSLAAIPDANERLRIAIHQLALGLEQGLAALARMVSFAAYGDPRLARTGSPRWSRFVIKRSGVKPRLSLATSYQTTQPTTR